LQVDADHKQPQDQRDFREGGDGGDHRVQRDGERRPEEGRPPQPIQHQQHTDDAREEGRPEYEVAGRDQPEAEEDQIDVEGLRMQVEEQERLRLSLRQHAQGTPASQDEQRDELEERGKRLEGARHEADGCRQEGDAPVHRLEQVVEEHRVRDVACDREQGGGDAPGV